MTEESTIYKGKIIGFASSFKTGMATLFIKRDDGEGHVVMCESAPTMKAFLPVRNAPLEITNAYEIQKRTDGKKLHNN